MINLSKMMKDSIQLIPKEHEDLITVFESVETSANYAAPEMMGFHWERAASELSEHLSDEIMRDEESWQFKVCKILNNQ